MISTRPDPAFPPAIDASSSRCIKEEKLERSRRAAEDHVKRSKMQEEAIASELRPARTNRVPVPKKGNSLKPSPHINSSQQPPLDLMRAHSNSTSRFPTPLTRQAGIEKNLGPAHDLMRPAAA